jgi:pimeloyl-ACP methyl ester carboxylesterase
MITQDKAESATQFYTWQNHQCAYEVFQPLNCTSEGIPLVLIHPIGVGLSKKFWHRFCREWYNQGHRNLIYNPDLLGCGESDKPNIIGTPTGWGEQLHYFVKTVVQRPVIVVAQGALFLVGLEIIQQESNLVRGFVIASPPPWSLISKSTPEWQHKFAWNIFSSPLGNLFYRYARTERFLRNFSQKNLFAPENVVDAEWLNNLQKGAEDITSRHAVFSFLSGFWRKDYSPKISAVKQPSLIVVGEKTSSISRKGREETIDEWLNSYTTSFPYCRGVKIPGRNVLPYESTSDFVKGIAEFVDNC